MPVSDLAQSHGGPVRVHTPGKYIVIFGAVPLLVLLIVAALTVFYEFRYVSAFTYRQAQNADGKTVTYYPLAEILVDLRPDIDGRRAFLKAKPSIELTRSDAAIRRTIDAARPVLMEQLTLYLRAMDPSAFSTAEGLERVKQALVKRANLVLDEDWARDVVLEELVIQ